MANSSIINPVERADSRGSGAPASAPRTAIAGVSGYAGCEIARLLLHAGADPNIHDDKYHATALGWAEFFGRPDFETLIREGGGQR